MQEVSPTTATVITYLATSHNNLYRKIDCLVKINIIWETIYSYINISEMLRLVKNKWDPLFVPLFNLMSLYLIL